MSICCVFSAITYAWEGGSVLAKDDSFRKQAVTRQEYEEHGHNLCLERFRV